jgi:hypothetical protein
MAARHTGNTWYVNSAAAAGGSGDSWGSAFTTLTAALAASVTDDVILIAPGHAESIPSIAFIAINKSVTIIGMGIGRRRPTFTWTTAITASISITASNVFISNIVFDGTGFDAITTMFLVTGSDVTFSNCEFDIANATNQVALGITVGVATTGGVNRFKFYGNNVHGTLNAGCTNFIQIVGVATFQNDFEFIGNSIIGAFTTTLGCINNITVACINMVIRENVMVNSTASATKCVVLLTGSTALIMRNSFGIGSGAVPVTTDGGWSVGNWTSTSGAITISTLM